MSLSTCIIQWKAIESEPNSWSFYAERANVFDNDTWYGLLLLYEDDFREYTLLKDTGYIWNPW